MTEPVVDARYAGRPFLRLLDSYVLAATGCMHPDAEKALAEMEPQLRKAYGLKGDWKTIVEQRMNFKPGMTKAIREVWDKGAIKFMKANGGTPPDPREFTRHFVDTHFPR